MKRQENNKKQLNDPYRKVRDVDVYARIGTNNCDSHYDPRCYNTTSMKEILSSYEEFQMCLKF